METTIFAHINWIIVVLVLLGGEFAKKYLCNVNLPVAIKTLIMGTLFTGVYIAITAVYTDFDKAQMPDFFLSYCIATSLYELALKYVIDGIKKRFGNEK